MHKYNCKVLKYYVLFLSAALLVVIAFVVSGILNTGHFLFLAKNDGDTGYVDEKQMGVVRYQETDHYINKSLTVQQLKSKVEYANRLITINKNRQSVFWIKISPHRQIKVGPVLSHNSVFGFENTSEILSHAKAYMGISGSFFHAYGQPVGLVVSDGRLITSSEGRYPVFIQYEDGSFSIVEAQSRIWLEIEGNRIANMENGAAIVENGGVRIEIDALNRDAKSGGIVAYNDAYGSTTRAAVPNISFVVQDGKVVKVVDSRKEKESFAVKIPKVADPSDNRNSMDDFVLLIGGDEEIDSKEPAFEIGNNIRLIYEIEGFDNKPMSEQVSQSINKSKRILQAYQCGSWIVKDGISVIKQKDEWVGLTTNREPRAAVGFKQDGTLVLFAVDGRQEGYSIGFNGNELAQYLLDNGIKHAAMLDGGASTTVVAGGRVVNKPSFNGKERPMSGAIGVWVQVP